MENKVKGLMKRIGAGAVGAVALASAGCASLGIKVDSLKFNESIELPTLNYYIKEAKQKAQKEEKKRKEEEIAKELGVSRGDLIDLGNGYKTSPNGERNLMIIAGILDGSMEVEGFYDSEVERLRVYGRPPSRLKVRKDVLDVICEKADYKKVNRIITEEESYDLLEAVERIYIDKLKGRK